MAPSSARRSSIRHTVPCFPFAFSGDGTRVSLKCGQCHRLSPLTEDEPFRDGRIPQNDPSLTRCPCSHRHLAVQLPKPIGSSFSLVANWDSNPPAVPPFCTSCEYTAFFPLVVCWCCGNRQAMVWRGPPPGNKKPRCNKCKFKVDSSWTITWEVWRFEAKVLDGEYVWCQVESAVVEEPEWGASEGVKERVLMEPADNLMMMELMGQRWDMVAGWWKDKGLGVVDPLGLF